MINIADLLMENNTASERPNNDNPIVDYSDNHEKIDNDTKVEDDEPLDESGLITLRNNSFILSVVDLSTTLPSSSFLFSRTVLPSLDTIFETIYGFSIMPSLATIVMPCSIWIGLTMIPWPYPAVAASTSYLKLISPVNSLFKVIFVFLPKPNFS